jgi:hypothetical protein
MMTVFLCFAAAERLVAERIAARLERAAGVQAVLDQIPDQTLPAEWERGTASAGIVLLLSPASVPPRLSRNDWDELLRHVGTHAEPALACLLVQPCRFPPLLERTVFLSWNEPEVTLRKLQQWVMSLHPADSSTFAPALQPHFTGREVELDRLWSSLVDEPDLIVVTGASRAGKTSLAQEFARQAQTFFRSVVWVSCRGRSQSCILGDLAKQLGLKSPYPFEESVTRLFRQHRILAILDELEHDDLAHELRDGAASVLVTRRSALPGLSTLDLTAIRLAVPGLPDSPEQRVLWEAMTVCRPDQVPLDLAAAMAEISFSEAAEICGDLVSKRLIDLLDQSSATYRLNWPAAIQDCEAELQRRHAQVMLGQVDSNPAEAKMALDWACTAGWDLAVPLGKRLFSFLRAEGRIDDASAVLGQLQVAAEQRGDPGTVEFAQYELSWISGSPWAHAATAAANAQQLRFDFSL